MTDIGGLTKTISTQYFTNIFALTSYVATHLMHIGYMVSLFGTHALTPRLPQVFSWILVGQGRAYPIHSASRSSLGSESSNFSRTSMNMTETGGLIEGWSLWRRKATKLLYYMSHYSLPWEKSSPCFVKPGISIFVSRRNKLPSFSMMKMTKSILNRTWLVGQPTLITI